MYTHTPPDRSKPSVALIAVGLGVLALGGILLAGGLGLFDAWAVIHKSWPIIFILIGIVSLSQPSWRWSGLIWIAVPIYLYARQQRWINFDIWAVLPPLLILLVGGVILYRAFAGPMVRGGAHETTANYIRSNAILSGTDLRPDSQSFSGAELTAVMGSVKLDLTSAEIAPDGAVIDVFTVFGGIELHVPSSWAVKIDTQHVLAALVDNRRPTIDPRTKTLTLRGFALFAGIDIRN